MFGLWHLLLDKNTKIFQGISWNQEHLWESINNIDGGKDSFAPILSWDIFFGKEMLYRWLRDYCSYVLLLHYIMYCAGMMIHKGFFPNRRIRKVCNWKKSLALSVWDFFMDVPNWIFIILQNWCMIWLTSYLAISKNNQMTQVQSSVSDINYRVSKYYMYEIVPKYHYRLMKIELNYDFY